VIVHAMETGEASRIVANVMNDGGSGGLLIPNLAADACVEVPATVGRDGWHPIPAGALEPQLAAYIHPAVDAQALTVRAALDEDRDAVYHAVMQDPLIQARLSLDEVWRLTDELIAAEAEWLPAWLGGAVQTTPSPGAAVTRA
jgi:alpha-galactosidase